MFERINTDNSQTCCKLLGILIRSRAGAARDRPNQLPDIWKLAFLLLMGLGQGMIARIFLDVMPGADSDEIQTSDQSYVAVKRETG